MKKTGVILIAGVILLSLLLGVYFVIKNKSSRETEETMQQTEESSTLISLEDVKHISFEVAGEHMGWT